MDGFAKEVSDGMKVRIGVQWLRLYAPKAGALGSIPGQGSRSYILHLEIPTATSKTQQTQINKYFKKYMYLFGSPGPNFLRGVVCPSE